VFEVVLESSVVGVLKGQVLHGLHMAGLHEQHIHQQQQEEEEEDAEGDNGVYLNAGNGPQYILVHGGLWFYCAELKHLYRFVEFS
jgi:hypothetical protein